jgi:hypothetical protein
MSFCETCNAIPKQKMIRFKASPLIQSCKYDFRNSDNPPNMDMHRSIMMMACE